MTTTTTPPTAHHQVLTDPYTGARVAVPTDTVDHYRGHGFTPVLDADGQPVTQQTPAPRDPTRGWLTAPGSNPTAWSHGEAASSGICTASRAREGY